jgi:hypothetical protein
VESLQSHTILTMSHWSSGLPVCFPPQGTQVQIPWGDLCETGILLLALSRYNFLLSNEYSEYNGELIKNTNNSSNIQKNYKSFLGVSNETRRSCLMKKTESKNDIVPLTSYSSQCSVSLPSKILSKILNHIL